MRRLVSLSFVGRQVVLSLNTAVVEISGHHNFVSMMSTTNARFALAAAAICVIVAYFFIGSSTDAPAAPIPAGVAVIPAPPQGVRSSPGPVSAIAGVHCRFRFSERGWSAPLMTAVMPALAEHPSCMVARANPALPVPESFLCFKHGGHFPGAPRSGAVAAMPAALKAARCASPDGLEWHIAADSLAVRRELKAYNRRWKPNAAASAAAATTGRAAHNAPSTPLAASERAAEKKHESATDALTTQLILRDAIVVDGEIYSGVQPTGTAMIRVAGIYSMVSNNWPQSLTRTVPVHALDMLPAPVQANRQMLAVACRSPPAQEFSGLCRARDISVMLQTPGAVSEARRAIAAAAWRFGYWQPATDFLSSYHVVVEVALPMFHAMLRSAARRRGLAPAELWDRVLTAYGASSPAAAAAAAGGDGGREIHLPCLNSAAAVTSRPRKAMWGFKAGSCKHGAAKCLASAWATLYTTLFSFVAPHLGAAAESATPSAPPPPRPTFGLHRVGAEEHAAALANGESMVAAPTDPAVASSAAPPERSLPAAEEAASSSSSPQMATDRSTDCDAERDPVPAMTATATQRGDRVVLGLAGDAAAERETPRFFDTLHAGYPPYCEPLWGGDPIFLNESAELLRAAPRMLRASVRECDLLLWATRGVLVSASRQAIARAQQQGGAAVGTSSSPSSSVVDRPVVAARRGPGRRPSPPVVLFSTRRDDWARDVVNEEDVLRRLDAHIHRQYCGAAARGGGVDDASCGCDPAAVGSAIDVARRNQAASDNANNNNNKSSSSLVTPRTYCHIQVVKFGGSLQSQVARVLVNATVFIGPHGANLLPTLFLPPNGGVITLDADPKNGFFPYGTFPSWLHWRRLALDRTCNRRLDANRKSCKVRSANNDNLVVSRAQEQRLADYLDEIVRAQYVSAKAAPFKYLS